MNDFIPTVIVQTTNGPVRVNREDYRPVMGEIISGENPVELRGVDVVRLADQAPDAYKEAADKMAQENAKQAAEIESLRAQLANKATASVVEAPAPITPPVAAPVYLVSKKGAKSIVVDGAGVPVVSELIDAKGYASESEAWTAIMALTKPAE